MKILITGGCGFVGFNLSKFYIEKGSSCTIVDNFYKKDSFKNYNLLKEKYKNKFKFIKISISNNRIISLIREQKFDVIIHLAGQVSMLKSLKDPNLDFKSNLLGTFKILESIRKYSIKTKLIYASSNKVYGNLGNYNYKELKYRYECIDKINGFDEKESLNFHSPYACSKGSADQYVQDYSRIYNLNTVVFRHSTIYGPNQLHTIDQGWIGWFCSLFVIALKEQNYNISIKVNGNGKQVRDLLNIKDLIKLYDKSINNFEKIKGGAFNIGGGKRYSLSIVELLNFLQKITNIKYELQHGLPRSGDQIYFVSNNKKIESLIKWSPKINPLKGIEEQFNWLAK